VKALTIIAATAALLVAPAAATADLPVGEADGVRVVREHGGIVVVFTAKADKLYKRIAGKRVIVSCTEILEDGANTGAITLPAPRRRGKLVTGDRTRGMDYCRVWLAPRTIKRHGQRFRLGRRLIVSIPLTQQGAVFIDEETKTRDMLQVGLIASLVEEREKLPGHPTYEQLVAELPRFAKLVVKLAAPSDTPPAGKIGYFSDGVEHLALVTVSASGRRLFIETAADEYFATNVAEYIFNGPY
jgi:hypothetical protein